jgi:4-amino-4-deoxy-L-arabinose transferase-like glycosyltransferase
LPIKPAAIRSTWLWIAVVAFLLAAVLVNPLREMTLEDDWAYALTVRNLTTTGHYALNDWAAANMPFQAYWGALFCAVGGFSLAALRLSTVVLSLLGLVAFYKLAREHELDERAAGLLALAYLASPLLFRFGFNFMTDAPFIALLVAALWLYARAIRTESFAIMIAASVVAAASVLTRQFGAALVAGLFMVWIADRDSRRRYLFFFSGMILPALAALWQFRAGVADPTWAQIYSKTSIADYFADVPHLLASFVWRPAVSLQYAALFTLPLIPAALARLRSRDDASGAPLGSRRVRIATVAVAAYLVIGTLVGHFALKAPLTMPFLPWNFDVLGRFGTAFGAALAVGVTAWGALLGGIIIGGWLESRGRAKAPPALRLLGWTTLALLALTLIFFKIGDDYVLVFIPFVLIAAGRELRPMLGRRSLATAAAAMAMLLVAGLWTREILSTEEALWNGGRIAVARGADPAQVDAGWNWACYHGAFERFLVSIDRRPMKNSEAFFSSFKEGRKNARYTATTARADSAAARLVATIPFRTMLLRERQVYLYMNGADSLAPNEGPRNAR